MLKTCPSRLVHPNLPGIADLPLPLDEQALLRLLLPLQPASTPVFERGWSVERGGRRDGADEADPWPHGYRPLLSERCDCAIDVEIRLATASQIPLHSSTVLPDRGIASCGMGHGWLGTSK